MIRFFDILISILVLLILFPIIFLVSILILIIDGKPLIFKQERVGKDGRKFKIFKFRTMNSKKFKNEELRLTTLGRILRRLSLDEMPQFINVLRNEMSIVGPRPLPKNIENRISKTLKKKRRKVLPGITGVSQINFTGKRRRLIDKIYLDINYIENYSLLNYWLIILKTPLTLTKRFFKNETSIIK